MANFFHSLNWSKFVILNHGSQNGLNIDVKSFFDNGVVFGVQSNESFNTTR